MFQSSLDICTSNVVAGWAWDSEQPDTPISLDVFDGLHLLRRIVANLFREDLVAAGIGSGHCAFHFTIPPTVADGLDHEFHVRCAETGQELNNSPQTVVWKHGERYTHEYQKNLCSSLHSPPWHVTDATYVDNQLEIVGWALPPANGRQTTFLVNGQPLEEVRSFPSPEVENVFWYWPNPGYSTFVGRVRIGHQDLFENGAATLEYADAARKTALYPWHNFYWPCNLMTIDDLPPAPMMARVAGQSERYLFLQDGFTTFVKLRQVVEALSGRWPEGETLDWGCGCGRITRWLRDAMIPGVRVHGADIDPQNLQWCSERLPGITFSRVPLHPPTCFADSQFSVVLGISVMTHLQEDIQFEWLEELSRITKPGAILTLSIHGNSSMCQMNPVESRLTAWKEAGFDAATPDPAFNEVIADKAYYRSSFHTQDYIRLQWSRHFEIVEVIPALVSNHQDLVVLKRL